MTCPSCTGYGHNGYRKGRPQPCRKCAGTGRIAPAHPQGPALLRACDLMCSCGRSVLEHEAPCMGSEIRASECSAIGNEMGAIVSGSLAPQNPFAALIP
jgi:hypothetical protein